MRLAWAGVVAAGIGLVLSALLWTFGVLSTEGLDPMICYSRPEFEVPCEVLGFDMRRGRSVAIIVLLVSVALAAVAIRMGQRPRRRRRTED